MANIQDLNTSLSAITGLSKHLGAIDKEGAKSLQNLGEGIKAFATIDIRSLKSNLENVSVLGQSITDITKALHFENGLQKNVSSFGGRLKTISEGLNAFGSINVGKIEKNIKGLSKIPNFINQLTASFSGPTSENFKKNAEAFGSPLSQISNGIASFANIDLTNLGKNLEELKMFPDFVSDISWILTAPVAEGFAENAEAFAAPLKDISEAIKAFSQDISWGNILKNILGFAIFAKSFKVLDTLPTLENSKEISESFGPMGVVFDSLQKFGQIGFGGLLKNVILFKAFGPVLRMGLRSLAKGDIDLKKMAEDFGKPLNEIAEALNKFASVRWGKVLIFAAMFKMFHKILFMKKGVKVTGGPEEKKKEEGGLFLSLLSGLGSALGSLPELLGGALRGALGMIPGLLAAAGPVLAVAAAGALGFAAGTWLDNQFGISDKISKALGGTTEEHIKRTREDVSANRLNGVQAGKSFIKSTSGSDSEKINTLEAKRTELLRTNKDLFGGGFENNKNEIEANLAAIKTIDSEIGRLKGPSISAGAQTTGAAMAAISADTANTKASSASPVIISGGSSSGVQTNNVTTVVQSKAFDRTDMVAYGFRGGRHR